jgi:hypothetical protein
MKTALTEYIEGLDQMAKDASSEPMRVALNWHVNDLKKFEKYTQLIRAVEPELHRNALLYSGMIDTEDND